MLEGSFAKALTVSEDGPVSASCWRALSPGACARVCVSVSEQGCLSPEPQPACPSAQTSPGPPPWGREPGWVHVVLENLEEPSLSVPECLTRVPQTVTGLLSLPPSPMGQRLVLVSGPHGKGAGGSTRLASLLTPVFHPPPQGRRGQRSVVGSVLYVRVHARHFVVLYVHTFRVL